MLSCFHVIPERHGETDRRTDRISISISRVSTLTRDKKSGTFLQRGVERSLLYLTSLVIVIFIWTTRRFIRQIITENRSWYSSSIVWSERATWEKLRDYRRHRRSLADAAQQWKPIHSDVRGRWTRLGLRQYLATISCAIARRSDCMVGGLHYVIGSQVRSTVNRYCRHTHAMRRYIAARSYSDILVLDLLS